MKINDWSVLNTPDLMGLAIKPMFEEDYEVIVAYRNGQFEVSIHLDGVDDPLVTMTYKVQPRGE